MPTSGIVRALGVTRGYLHRSATFDAPHCRNYAVPNTFPAAFVPHLALSSVILVSKDEDRYCKVWWKWLEHPCAACWGICFQGRECSFLIHCIYGMSAFTLSWLPGQANCLFHEFKTTEWPTRPDACLGLQFALAYLLDFWWFAQPVMWVSDIETLPSFLAWNPQTSKIKCVYQF